MKRRLLLGGVLSRTFAVRAQAVREGALKLRKVELREKTGTKDLSSLRVSFCAVLHSLT